MTFIFISSCSEAQAYREDVRCSTLTGAISSEAKNDADFVEYTNEELSFLFSDLSQCDDYSIIYSISTSDISEIGVFHCPDEESAKNILEIATSYVEDQKINQRAFISSYAPYELEKLDNAEVHNYGRYVVYVILDQKNASLAFDTIENLLKK